MNAIPGFSAVSSLLPAQLQPYTLWLVIAVAVVLVFFCWPIIRFVLRVGWTVRLILMAAALFAAVRFSGCTPAGNQPQGLTFGSH